MRPLRPPSVPTLPGVRISGEEGKRGTVGVNKIEDIRRRARAGEPVASIVRHVGVSEPTVRKHARMAGLSPEPPSVRRPESKVLAPCEGTIDSRVDNDGSNWRKQHWLDGFKAYLSAAVDCFDGWPVCWRVSLHPDAGLALGTLGDLVAAVRPTEGRPLVLHSGGSAVYMTDEWAAACAVGHVTRSMSRKARSPDNARCEGLFGTIKSDFFHGTDWRGVTFAEFREELGAYIE